MKMNGLGEPRPATFDEVSEALGIVGLVAEEAQAVIFDSREDLAPYTGFTAEISNAEDGSQMFCTCGFPDKEALIEGLNNLGIVLIDDAT